ncbi:hypothetical protein J7337_002039 [Fusarium musae]|uniref:Uncharacterized protein n=1 Tax=Fusarium musae TaxID=1042133 RepID=A0A9P8ITR4_9HYPO|nr:hypothetical protein J7337_002039 [Fusarium musae]KAG9505073.1 hypothetical protein J7337_002039 [Fusarium musae]
MSDSLAQLQQDAIKSIASVSSLLRNAIGASLPVAPEQYLTIAVPGTVIDLDDYENGGSFVWDASKHATTPTTVRQAEATLVDGMMPVASIMIGNTGRSVARSYTRSLDALLPVKATISGADAIRSPGNKEYDDAMKFLKLTEPGSAKTIVEIYRDKQLAWAKEQSSWDTAKINAEERAQKLFPPGSSSDYISKQKEYINNWNQETYLMFKASVQAAWMDWVVNGQKYNVDYSFGMVDIDSIMSRIEDSKESLRNSTIPDATGSSEVYGVSLTPSKWATYCKRKAEGWYTRNGTYTLAQLESEITRLESLLRSYELAKSLVEAGKDDKTQYPVAGAEPPSETVKDTEAKVNEAMKTLYEKQAAVAGVVYNLQQGKPGDKEKAQKEVLEAQRALQAAQDKNETNQQAWNEYNNMVLTDSTKKDALKWFDTKETTINQELDRLKSLREAKAGNDTNNATSIPVIVSATAPAPAPDGKDSGEPAGTTLAARGSEMANPVFKSPSDQPPTAQDADPWTNITFSYSASDVAKHSKESEWGMKIGGSVGFGLWSVGGSYAHDESHKSMQEDMAACDVSISFSALVVNINRPWLFGELFSDVDIEVAKGVKLSPGPILLQKMIKEQNAPDIATWSQFPAYPTSFIVAADTTIEFTGATKHIEEHFDSHSNSGGASVGYGPWSVSSTFHESASEQSMQVHSTSTGCKISFGAPQIIGWVSQIVPALPRDEHYEPLTQGNSVVVPK